MANPLLGALGGGGGLAVSPSSGVNATTPQSNAAGSVLFNFGGINLGNQDTPFNQVSADPTNQTPTIGTVPPTGVTGLPSAVGAINNWLPTVLVGAAIVALVLWTKGKL